MGMVIDAAVRKGFTWPGGFYRMIGGRAVVRTAVDTALFRPCGGDICDPWLVDRLWTKENEETGQFSDVINRFLHGDGSYGGSRRTGVTAFDTSGDLYDKMDKALRNYQSSVGPVDWGNITDYTKKFDPFIQELKSELPREQKLLGDNEIYYRNAPYDGVNNIFYILTTAQSQYWCSGSCVAGLGE